MNRKLLKQIEATRREIEHIDKILSKYETKIVEDSVQGSSSGFPYIQRHIKIEGFENPKNRRKYVNMVSSHKNKLEKQKIKLEYEIERISDSEIRTIIRMKYFEGLTFNQIAHRLNDNGGFYTEDSVRKKLNRFFEEENNEQITKNSK